MTKAMQEPTFLILTALADGPQHGYGIISDAEQISGGRTRLRAGTLYAALDRLQSDGLIAADREEVVDGRLRRYYRLTDDGAAALATEIQALRRRTEAAARRLSSFPRLERGTSPA
jgi:DNA-binding PadR family transcriptional regulator